MQILSAMFIESGISLQQSIEAQNPTFVENQRKELSEALGAETAKQLGVTFPITPEAQTMFFLGLNSARAALSENVELISKGIDPSTIL